MFAMLACMLLTQFKVGEEVYVIYGAEVYRTAEDAVSRRDGANSTYPHGKVIAVKELDGETAVRIKREDYEVPVWSVTANVRPWNAETKKQVAREATILKEELEKQKAAITGKSALDRRSDEIERIRGNMIRLQPYLMSPKEVMIARQCVDMGIDPMKITNEQLKQFKPSDRKVLSYIRGRVKK